MAEYLKELPLTTSDKITRYIYDNVEDKSRAKYLSDRTTGLLDFSGYSLGEDAGNLFGHSAATGDMLGIGKGLGLLGLGVIGSTKVPNLSKGIKKVSDKVYGLLGKDKKIIPIGPFGVTKVNIVAKNKPVYRETNHEGLDEFLINSQNNITHPMYVSDSVDLALGQRKNKGALIEFLPNTVSGIRKLKPAQSKNSAKDLGAEYLSNVISPKPINKITFKEKGWGKKITPTTRAILRRDFKITKDRDATIFTRK